MDPFHVVAWATTALDVHPPLTLERADQPLKVVHPTASPTETSGDPEIGESMDAIERSERRVTIGIDIDQLRIIYNALNEVCNALPRASFETRIGATLADARLLLNEVNALLPE